MAWRTSKLGRYSMFRSFPRKRESSPFFPVALDPRFRGDERDGRRFNPIGTCFRTRFAPRHIGKSGLTAMLAASLPHILPDRLLKTSARGGIALTICSLARRRMRGVWRASDAYSLSHDRADLVRAGLCRPAHHA